MCDLQFSNCGSFASCSPATEAGKEWMFNNLMDGTPGVEEAIGDCMWPVYIEHRYLEDIVLGARADGLVCEG